MRWTSITSYFGIRKPYDFKTAIPFLLGTAGFCSVVILSTVLMLQGTLDLGVLVVKGGLSVGTERFYFLLYLAVFFVLAALFSKSTLIASAIVVWCAIDLGFALISSTLAEYGVGNSVFPQNGTPLVFNGQFIYHPVLQAVLKPKWHEAKPISAPDTTNIHEHHEQEFLISHNSLGVRGSEVTAQDLKKPLIFVYGGSTTYDLGVTQGKTWVERLQSLLGGKYTVLNFGVPGYTTTEHLIQTAFYESVSGKAPVCTIYYVGWNDLRNAHVGNLDAAYANFHLLSQVDSLEVRRQPTWLARYSAIIRLGDQKARERFDTVPRAPTFSRREPLHGSDESLERVFVDHVRTIADINNGRGIRTVFVGQILNRTKLVSNRPYGWLPLVADKDVWPLQERFNELLMAAALDKGAVYVDAGVDNFQDEDFVDNGHFSEAGAEKFARLIVPRLSSGCAR